MNPNSEPQTLVVLQAELQVVQEAWHPSARSWRKRSVGSVEKKSPALDWILACLVLSPASLSCLSDEGMLFLM